jgi:hypothetical protein
MSLRFWYRLYRANGHGRISSLRKAWWAVRSVKCYILPPAAMR